MKKLNPFGFAHHVVLMAVIVLVGIGGSAYLIMSHADSCTGTSDPTSGATATSDPVSTVTCTATSDPVSAVSDPGTSPTYSYTCAISGVPTSIASGGSVTPVVTLTNTGTASVTPTISYAYQTVNSPNPTAALLNAPAVASGQSVSVKLNSFTAVSKFTTTDKLNVSVAAKDISNPTCNSPTFVVNVPPIHSVTIKPADWQNLVKASVVTDATKGSALKVSYTGSASTLAGKASIAKLTDFTQANAGHKASLCVDGKASLGSSKLSLALSKVESVNSTKTFTLRSTYTSQCVTVALPTIDSSLTASTNPSFNQNQNALITVKGPTSAFFVDYLANLTLTVL